MADQAAHPENGNTEEEDRQVFDLLNDARWKARLDEARERRQRALAEKGQHPNKERQPKKPWEDQIASNRPREVILPSDEPNSGLDFFDRMDALKKAAKRGASDNSPKQTEPAPDAISGDEASAHVSNSDAGLSEEDTKLRDKAFGHENEPEPDMDRQEIAISEPKEIQEPELEISNTEMARSQPVDQLFQDPIFTDQDEPEPTSLLLPKSERELPMPTSNRRAWIVEDDEEESIEFVPETPVYSEPEKPKRRRPRLGIWMILLAAAIGPAFVYLSPVERGPVGPGVAGFAAEPGLGITSAMLERGVSPSEADKRPTHLSAPKPPQSVSVNMPPQFLQSIPAFARRSELVVRDHGITVSRSLRSDRPLFRGVPAAPNTRETTFGTWIESFVDFNLPSHLELPAKGPSRRPAARRDS